MKRLSLLLLALVALLIPASTRGQSGGRAGLVVLFSDGSVRSSCVAFEGESISGLELLQRSGLDVIAQVSGNNAAVCKIGGDGCNYPAEPCFCKFGGGQQGQYWAYWQQVEGAWKYSAQGAGSVRVRDGDVNGWAWGTGNVQSGAQPPLQTFAQICSIVDPTMIPPTTSPPTAIPASPVPPTAIPPSPRPTTQPTPRPTMLPSVAGAAQQPTDPVATATGIPASPTTAAPTETVQATETIAVTALTTPTSLPTMLATPTQVAAGAANDQAPQGSVISYVVFGVMLAAIVGAIIFVQRRRAR